MVLPLAAPSSRAAGSFTHEFAGHWLPGRLGRGGQWTGRCRVSTRSATTEPPYRKGILRIKGSLGDAQSVGGEGIEPPQHNGTWFTARPGSPTPAAAQVRARCAQHPEGHRTHQATQVQVAAMAHDDPT